MSTEPTPKQMEALERVLSGRKGLRQELDEIRNVDDPPEDADSAEWIKHESPLVIDIMREAASAVMSQADD